MMQTSRRSESSKESSVHVELGSGVGSVRLRKESRSGVGGLLMGEGTGETQEHGPDSRAELG